MYRPATHGHAGVCSQACDPSGESVPGVKSDGELRGSQECCPLWVLSSQFGQTCHGETCGEKSQPKSESADLNLDRSIKSIY